MNKLSRAHIATLALLLGVSALATSAQAAAPATTVIYQPMVSTGLAAHEPFEAWFAFDKSSDPIVPGYAVPAGATIHFVFPHQFTPKKGLFLGTVMLQGWTQAPIHVKFAASGDPNNPRALTIKLEKPIGVAPPDAPGLKDIHLRVPVLNPAKAGDYPIRITFTNAGALSGTTTAVAHITPKPVPNVAADNDLTGGKDSNWQHVKAGQEAALPIDFLVTLPGVPRSVIALKPLADGNLSILSDRKPIGSVKAQGVPVTMLPVTFGPGKARLGIIRLHVKAGDKPGNAEIIASLNHGTHYKINLVVDAAAKVTGH